MQPGREAELFYGMMYLFTAVGFALGGIGR
jgi:hypothetical protein